MHPCLCTTAHSCIDPAGRKTNYKQHDLDLLFGVGMSGDVALLAVSIALTAVALLAVAGRSVSSFLIAKQSGLEDALVIVSACCSVALTILFAIGKTPLAPS